MFVLNILIIMKNWKLIHYLIVWLHSKISLYFKNVPCFLKFPHFFFCQNYKQKPPAISSIKWKIPILWHCYAENVRLILVSRVFTVWMLWNIVYSTLIFMRCVKYMPLTFLLFVKLWNSTCRKLIFVLFPMLFVVYRCRKSADFSLKCAWFLDAYSSDAHLLSKKKSHGTKLKDLILSDELRPKETDSTLTRRTRVSTGGPAPDCSKMKELASPTVPSGPPPPLPPSTPVTSPNKKTHQRSQSDATGLYPGHRRMLSSGNFV